MEDLIEVLTQSHESIITLCLELQKHTGDDEKSYYDELLDDIERKLEEQI